MSMKCFKVLAALVAAPVVGAALLVSVGPRPASAHESPAVEAEAEWQILCTLSHQRPDDPIVFPGQPGVSHMHSFYGNSGTNAASTTASLLGATSTCGRNLQASDHSAYWIPALYRKNAANAWTLVTSDSQEMFIYYVRAGGPNGPKVKPFPAGLRMVAGDQHATSAQPATVLEWTCGGAGPTSADIPQCSDPSQPIHASLGFPSCWDGVHLDSADHRSHMAYAAPDGTCPASHPVSLPKLSYEVDYPGITGGPGYQLASGGRFSMHGDFFNAWDTRVQNALVSDCLNAAHDCLDITRDGDTLFKPGDDPNPIPPISLAAFSSTPETVGQEPTGSPTPAQVTSPSPEAHDHGVVAQAGTSPPASSDAAARFGNLLLVSALVLFGALGYLVFRPRKR
jgi:hypothetical protein